MPLDPHNFLDAMADHLVAELELDEEDGRQVWTGPADETQVPQDDEGRVGVYTELRNYDNAIATIGLPTASIQARTVGYDEAAVRLRAVEIARALLDEAEKPARNFTVPPDSGEEDLTFKVVAVMNLRGPSYVSRDEKGRPEWIVNFDCQYVPLA